MKPKFTILRIAIKYAIFKAIFYLAEAEKICIAWHIKS